MGNRKQVSLNEQLRQLSALEAVNALKREVEDWAYLGSANPRPATTKSLRKLQALLTVPRSVDIAVIANDEAPFLRNSRTSIKPKTLRERIELIAVRVWGFR